MKTDIVLVQIDAIWNEQDPPRLVQRFDANEICEEWCVHGVKLRWSCNKCEEYLISFWSEAGGV